MKFSGRFVLLVLSSFLGLAAAEGVVRAAGWAPQIMRIRPGMKNSAFELSENPVLGYVLKAGYRNEAPNNIENVGRTNSAGFRDIERSLESASNRPRVLMLGDSVVMGLGLESLEETISRQLEALSGERVEVLNFGIAGYCTRGQVELLDTKGLEYRPDLVAMVFVENDYEDANSQTSYYAFDRPKWAKSAFLHSEAFRVAALRHNWFHFQAEIDKEYAMRRHQNALGADNVRRGVERLAELTKEKGFETLVAIWPSFTSNGIVDRPGPHGAKTAGEELRIEKLCRDSGLESVRLSEGFRADFSSRQSAGETRDAETIYTREPDTDVMHPNAEGAHTAAQILLDLIESRLAE